MPLVKGKSEGAFKTNVSTLMGEIGKSPHVQSRAQALAIAFSKKRSGKAAGGAVTNPWMAAGGAAAISPHMPTAPWYERNALRHSGPAKGMLGGASPGRVDNLPINVKSGSYVVPADVVSAIGQGNSKSGAKMMTKMFSGSKMNAYGGGNFRMKGVTGLQRGQFQEGGMVPEDDISNAGAIGEQNPIISAMGTAAKSRKENVSIIAASGEFVICPEDVLAFGDGHMKRGLDALDNWVKGQRKKHIDTLRKLKPPKAD